MDDNIRFSLVKQLLNSELLQMSLAGDGNAFDFHWFEIERAQFLSVFKCRLKKPSLSPLQYVGLKQILDSFESSTEQSILSNTIGNEKSDILVYASVDMGTLFGFLEFHYTEGWYKDQQNSYL